MAPSKMPAATDRALARMSEIGEDLASHGVTAGKMFGVPSLKASGKLLCSVWGDDLAVKLPPTVLEPTLKLKGVTRFSPMAGREMKEWARVPYAHRTRWPELVGAALGYIGKG